VNEMTTIKLGNVVRLIPIKRFYKGDRVILPANTWNEKAERGTVLGMSSRTTCIVELDSQFRESALDDLLREVDVDDIRRL
jgi:hypothetical protein